MMDDTRRTCQPGHNLGNGCQHYRPGKCLKPNAAGLAPIRLRLQSADVGPQLAALPQHCPAYIERQ